MEIVAKYITVRFKGEEKTQTYSNNPYILTDEYKGWIESNLKNKDEYFEIITVNTEEGIYLEGKDKKPGVNKFIPMAVIREISFNEDIPKIYLK